MLKPTYQIPDLPPPGELETVAVLRLAAIAHRRLAELKGRAATIPNPGILIDTLSLQEARASSEVENIVTTQDEMFQASLFPEGPASSAAKEVALYRDALHQGYSELARTGLVTNNGLIAMFRILKRTDSGFRTGPGTALRNEASEEIVYVPPQDPAEVVGRMSALEAFINLPEQSALDPLVKMAVIHHQFESIHPFPDGNGRIGRMLNVLYLVREGLLELPILYLSRYVTTHKADYYRLLQHTRDTGQWEPWLIYMLTAVAQTAEQTLGLVDGMRTLMSDYKQRLRGEHPRIYSQELLNNLFRHPYTRIDYVAADLGVTRQTASRYLEQLAASDMLEKHVAGRANFYINRPLVSLFVGVGG